MSPALPSFVTLGRRWAESTLDKNNSCPVKCAVEIKVTWPEFYWSCYELQKVSGCHWSQVRSYIGLKQECATSCDVLFFVMFIFNVNLMVYGHVIHTSCLGYVVWNGAHIAKVQQFEYSGLVLWGRFYQPECVPVDILWRYSIHLLVCRCGGTPVCVCACVCVCVCACLCE